MEGCYDWGISIDHEERCLGDSSEIEEEVYRDFKVDVQDQACCR